MSLKDNNIEQIIKITGPNIALKKTKKYITLEVIGIQQTYKNY